MVPAVVARKEGYVEVGNAHFCGGFGKVKNWNCIWEISFAVEVRIVVLDCS